MSCYLLIIDSIIQILLVLFGIRYESNSILVHLLFLFLIRVDKSSSSFSVVLTIKWIEFLMVRPTLGSSPSRYTESHELENLLRFFLVFGPKDIFMVIDKLKIFFMLALGPVT